MHVDYRALRFEYRRSPDQSAAQAVSLADGALVIGNVRLPQCAEMGEFLVAVGGRYANSAYAYGDSPERAA